RRRIRATGAFRGCVRQPDDVLAFALRCRTEPERRSPSACVPHGGALPSRFDPFEGGAPVSAHLTAAQIKLRLTHPVIDADGHWVEYGPVFTEQLRKVGGEDAVRGWNAVGGGVRGVL